MWLCSNYFFTPNAEENIFICFQIWHCTLSITPTLRFSILPLFERLSCGGPLQKGLISDAYKILNAYHIPTLWKHSYMIKWGRILGEELSLETWQVVWSRVAKSSFCTLYQEDGYKMLYLCYLTPHLHTIHPGASDCC